MLCISPLSITLTEPIDESITLTSLCNVSLEAKLISSNNNQSPSLRHYDTTTIQHNQIPCPCHAMPYAYICECMYMQAEMHMYMYVNACVYVVDACVYVHVCCMYACGLDGWIDKCIAREMERESD